MFDQFVAMQLHKMRVNEARTNLHFNRAVAEAIMLEKQEIMRARKNRRR